MIRRLLPPGGGATTLSMWSGQVRRLLDRLGDAFDGCLCWRIGTLLIRIMPPWTPPKRP